MSTETCKIDDSNTIIQTGLESFVEETKNDFSLLFKQIAHMKLEFIDNSSFDNCIMRVLHKMELQRLELEKKLLEKEIEIQKEKAVREAIENLSWFKRLFKKHREKAKEEAIQKVTEKYKIDLGNAYGLIGGCTFKYFSETFNHNFLKGENDDV